MNDEIDPIIARLEAERPHPHGVFLGASRRALVAKVSDRPRRIRLLVAAYGTSGLALLLVCAIGLAGVGPFAAG
jgi:hypothetical protein